jgi:hypothetical protein
MLSRHSVTVTMSQLPINQSTPLPPNNQPDIIDFEYVGVDDPFDELEWIALGHSDNTAFSLSAATHQYHSHSEIQLLGLQHDLIGSEQISPPSGAELLPNLSASWEMELDGAFNDQENSIGGAQAALSRQPSRQHFTPDGYIDPELGSSISFA